VLGWVRGTALVPVKEALSAELYAGFEAAYAARLGEAYPPEEDGTTLLPFRRIFVVLSLRGESSNDVG
jgi:trans-aconitate 2-methyltransferase